MRTANTAPNSAGHEKTFGGAESKTARSRHRRAHAPSKLSHASVARTPGYVWGG